jgi:hypothetical protein
VKPGGKSRGERGERGEPGAGPAGGGGAGDAAAALRRRHLRFGWWALLAFLTLGIALESFHGFKARFYLDVPQSTRRLLWTLAHAHGTLLALVNIAFGLSAAHLAAGAGRGLRLASASLVAAALLLPGGFFLGGVVFYGGDPGVGVLLVPLGALALLAGVFLAARATRDVS